MDENGRWHLTKIMNSSIRLDVFLTVACYPARKEAANGQNRLHGDTMETDEATYRSYLLRLWQVEQNGNFTWRCSLEEARTGQRQNFASIQGLLSYLLAETGEQSTVAKEEETS